MDKIYLKPFIAALRKNKKSSKAAEAFSVLVKKTVSLISEYITI